MMFHLRFLASVAPMVVLLAGAGASVAACEDSGGGGSPTFGLPEGGTFEAGPNADGSVPDSAAPDAAPKGVTVTIIEAAGPRAGIRVIFHDATGAVTGETVTDAAGKAAVAAAPSMVTVLYFESVVYNQPAVVTFMGVTDGDNLRIVPTPRPDGGGVAAKYSVSLTDGPAVTGATSFQITAGQGCSNSTNSTTAPVLVDLYPSCLAAKNAVLVEAYDELGKTVAHAFVKDVAKPAAGATVPVGPLAFVAAGSRAVTAQNLPAQSPSIRADAALVAIAGTQTVGFLDGVGDIFAPGGVIYPTATGFADAYRVALNVEQRRTLPLLDSATAIVRREAASAAATAALAPIDYATALPMITNGVVTGIARPEITITAPALTGADAGLLQITWYDPVAEMGGDWTFVVPGNVTTIKAPALPASGQTFAPPVLAELRSAMYFDSSLIPGYAAAKLLPVAPVNDTRVDEANALPTNGTLRVSRYRGSRG